jgi:hypothetical protein
MNYFQAIESANYLPTQEDLNAYISAQQTPDYTPTFPGRSLTAGICVYWRDHGRVYVESINGNVACVRPDCGEGTRGKVSHVKVSELDPAREWKFV